MSRRGAWLPQQQTTVERASLHTNRITKYVFREPGAIQQHTYLANVQWNERRGVHCNSRRLRHSLLFDKSICRRKSEVKFSIFCAPGEEIDEATDLCSKHLGPRLPVYTIQALSSLSSPPCITSHNVFAIIQLYLGETHTELGIQMIL